MTIEINAGNRNKAIRLARTTLEWEEQQARIVDEMAQPMHGLYGINFMLYARVNKARSIVNALESGYKLTLDGDEARAIGLI
jgi:hypothetical protein